MLLDTSGLMSLLNDTEPSYEAAVRQYDSASRKLVHNYILAELVPLAISRRFPLERTLASMDALTHDPSVEVIWIQPAIHEAAVQLLRERLDKSYSLCDAASFVLMRQRGITDALTTDRHFAQEGFRRLLTPA